MSWESTVTYYQVINRTIKEELGGFHSAKCLLYSVDFHEIEECQSQGNWKKSTGILSEAARALERAGADCIVLCTNTMHKVADDLAVAVSIPFLHIVDATAQEIRENRRKKILLLGTKYTMEEDFYKSLLVSRGIEVLIPDAEDRAFVNDTVYGELGLGVVSDTSRERFLRIMDKSLDKSLDLDSQGVVLGCTEIGLLVSQKDTGIKLFDTTLIHARRAALFSIGL
jgi:aspartate racemase